MNVQGRKFLWWWVRNAITYLWPNEITHQILLKWFYIFPFYFLSIYLNLTCECRWTDVSVKNQETRQELVCASPATARVCVIVRCRAAERERESSLPGFLFLLHSFPLVFSRDNRSRHTLLILQVDYGQCNCSCFVILPFLLFNFYPGELGSPICL